MCIRLDFDMYPPPIAADAEPLHTVAVRQSFPSDLTMRLVKLDSPKILQWLPFPKLVVELVCHDLPGLLGSAWSHVWGQNLSLWDPEESARLYVQAIRAPSLTERLCWRLQEATRLHGTHKIERWLDQLSKLCTDSC